MRENIKLVEQILAQVVLEGDDGSKLFTSPLYDVANNLADQLGKSPELNEACEQNPLLHDYLCLLSIACFRGDSTALPITYATATLSASEQIPPHDPTESLGYFNTQTKDYTPDKSSEIIHARLLPIVERQNLNFFIERVAALSLKTHLKTPGNYRGETKGERDQTDRESYFKNFGRDFYAFVSGALPRETPRQNNYDVCQRVIQAALIYWVLCRLHNHTQRLHGTMRVPLSADNLVVEGSIYPLLVEQTFGHPCAPSPALSECSEFHHIRKPTCSTLPDTLPTLPDTPPPPNITHTQRALDELRSYRSCTSGRQKKRHLDTAADLIESNDVQGALHALRAAMTGFKKHRNFAAEVCAIAFGFLLVIPGIVFAVMVAKKTGCFKRNKPTKSAAAASSAIQYLSQITTEGTSDDDQLEMRQA